MKKPLFTQEQWLEMSRARESLRSCKDKIVLYPALPETTDLTPPVQEIRIVDEEARGVAYYANEKIQKHLNPIKRSKYS